jgi:hypothetical protein
MMDPAFRWKSKDRAIPVDDLQMAKLGLFMCGLSNPMRILSIG